MTIVKQEARKLGEKVKEREDKYAKLEREHHKGLKTIHGMASRLTLGLFLQKRK